MALYVDVDCQHCWLGALDLVQGRKLVELAALPLPVALRRHQRCLDVHAGPPGHLVFPFAFNILLRELAVARTSIVAFVFVDHVAVLVLLTDVFLHAELVELQVLGCVCLDSLQVLLLFPVLVAILVEIVTVSYHHL